MPVGLRLTAGRSAIFACIVLGAVLLLAVPACASVWGFQDGILGNPDASATDGTAADGTGPLDTGVPIDAGPCTLECVPAAPSGWNGPFAISETTGGPPPPDPQACAGAFPSEVYLGFASPSGPAASCTCTCGAAAGASCAAPTVTVYTTTGCPSTGVCAAFADASLATCEDIGNCGGGLFADFGAPAPVPGTCAASGTTAVVDAGWSASARLCAATSVGNCAAGEACVPAAGLPFASAYCIATAADTTCPAGPYSHPRKYYTATSDTRGCSPCGCGPSSASCSGGTVTTFNSAGCTPAHTTIALPAACTNSFGGDKSAQYNNDAVVAPGACGFDGGQPIGDVTPTTPTTICCTQ